MADGSKNAHGPVTDPPSAMRLTTDLDAPTVSVLMTVYNGRRYLTEATESILAQTFDDFEFVIVDDGSTDGSVSILREFEKRDSRIRLYERPHMGYVRQLNFGLGVCRGKYVARMDADDVALPNRLATQVKAMRADPGLVVVGGGYELIDAAGRLLRREWPSSDDTILQENALSGQTPISHPTALIRRSAIEQVGRYDVDLETAEDNDLWLRLGEIGRLSSVQEMVLRYRQHDKSVSEQRAAEQSRRIREGCEKAYKRRGLDRVFVPPQAWRPSGEQSRYRFLLQYGWWALKYAKHRRTAMIYGLKALQKHPMGWEGWSLLTCAMVRPLPTAPAAPIIEYSPAAELVARLTEQTARQATDAKPATRETGTDDANRSTRLNRAC